ncbi:hypothetical protein QTO34_009832 [Cnephaeus nilssonii]|uniref:Uncharacterized protein n=1 Tax=Cnephaeus nilssonii TaxID=3371016 RepID=A0AA40HE80_CNENI|nr:hypothetical protein QTO34_009832 [Eptesicus nilssonii]
MCQYSKRVKLRQAVDERVQGGCEDGVEDSGQAPLQRRGAGAGLHNSSTVARWDEQVEKAFRRPPADRIRATVAKMRT